ncbi:response regulator [Pacificimonas flava]|uniref:Response regulator n=2 Tax=Pacificimonas TaxID=1960290 RepID=A0A219B824_9SPHN|nr:MULTISPECIES: response regulator [Pacificimonas]MBZ6378800.1 response regulator [Pacificimonas aurantium]OWV33939.1 response regulator [Pacificimonas flava]
MSAGEPSATQEPRILLAEDDDSMRGFLQRAIERAGYRVTAVDRGTEAIPYLTEGGYDLLLTDIVMPEMDGIELAQRAAELQPGMRVIFITGFAAVALSKNSGAPQGAKVLSKPFHLRELTAEIERMLAA